MTVLVSVKINDGRSTRCSRTCARFEGRAGTPAADALDAAAYTVQDVAAHVRAFLRDHDQARELPVGARRRLLTRIRADPGDV